MARCASLAAKRREQAEPGAGVRGMRRVFRASPAGDSRRAAASPQGSREWRRARRESCDASAAHGQLPTGEAHLGHRRPGCQAGREPARGGRSGRRDGALETERRRRDQGNPRRARNRRGACSGGLTPAARIGRPTTRATQVIHSPLSARLVCELRLVSRLHAIAARFSERTCGAVFHKASRRPRRNPPGNGAVRETACAAAQRAGRPRRGARARASTRGLCALRRRHGTSIGEPSDALAAAPRERRAA